MEKTFKMKFGDMKIKNDKNFVYETKKKYESENTSKIIHNFFFVS